MALLLLLVGLLALRGAAEGAEGQQQPQQQPAVDIQYGDAGMSALMRGILHATNEGDDKLATKLREKLDALRQAPVEEAGATPWVTECEASAVLAAELFVISDPAEAPAGLSGAMGYLDEFWKTDKGEDLPYPGDFDQFMHDDGFRILRVAYDQLPAGVRKWREEQFATNTMERKFIAVLDGVAFFPPGVMTFLLPLFATQDVMAGQDPCQGESQADPSSTSGLANPSGKTHSAIWSTTTRPGRKRTPTRYSATVTMGGSRWGAASRSRPRPKSGPGRRGRSSRGKMNCEQSSPSLGRTLCMGFYKGPDAINLNRHGGCNDVFIYT